MSSTAFTSEIYEVSDALEANELYQRNGWTDGLPIVAPTEAAVSRFLAAAKLDAACVIGTAGAPPRHHRRKSRHRCRRTGGRLRRDIAAVVRQ